MFNEAKISDLHLAPSFRYNRSCQKPETAKTKTSSNFFLEPFKEECMAPEDLFVRTNYEVLNVDACNSSRYLIYSVISYFDNQHYTIKRRILPDNCREVVNEE